MFWWYPKLVILLVKLSALRIDVSNSSFRLYFFLKSYKLLQVNNFFMILRELLFLFLVKTLHLKMKFHIYIFSPEIPLKILQSQ